ncbi:MAG: hypothetical protein H7Z40_07670 [Phycisphaerae bacterium]|nr:hypothetical protein [Gemmatimonadaceae bacterium]
MKTTLDLDEGLYRQLKAHAALNGKSVKAVITDAINRLLTSSTPPVKASSSVKEAAPEWVGSLSKYASNASGQHDLASMRASISKGRQLR